MFRERGKEREEERWIAREKEDKTVWSVVLW